MDILLNDNSFKAQFTLETFISYMCEDIIPSLNLLQNSNCNVYKDFDTYNKKITRNKTLRDILIIQGEPTIDRLRIYLIQLFYDEPYWNNDIRTDPDKKYKCSIEDVPNCITEAYERKGLVYSFKDANYNYEFLNLICNNKDYNVRNAFNFESIQKHFSELGIIDLWTKNSFLIEGLGYKFEIRFAEDIHQMAHFHVSKADYSASVSIPDADIMAGNLPRYEEKKVVSWALQNMDKIIKMWNDIHDNKKVKFDLK